MLTGAPEIKRRWTADNGTVVTIRPIEADDREREQAFVRALSSRSRYLRFLSGVSELSERWLDRFTQLDFTKELALIATIVSGACETQIGVARYIQLTGDDTAEFAVVVADEWQGQGLGRELLQQLFVAAEAIGIRRMSGIVLKENRNMLKLAGELGFTVTNHGDDPSLYCVDKKI